ncbi:MAG: PEP-CTERM sorting domain-containing protein [Armatimonadota bacterium]
MSRTYLAALYISLVTAAVFPFSAAAAQTHYALATSPSQLFLFRDYGKWGSKSWSPLFSVSPGNSSLAGVASDERYVYVVDQTSRSVIIGTVGNILDTPVWQQVAVVLLRGEDGTEVPSPRQIAVDGAGGFYVTGGVSGGRSYFAHVKPSNGSWNQPIVSIGELPGAVIADVAVGKSGTAAVIAHLKDTPSTRTSWTCKAIENTVSDAYSLLPNSYNARAIAVLPSAGTDGYAYVANYNSDNTFTKGSVRIVDIATGAPKGTSATELLPNMVPDDIAAFTVAGSPYLAVIGRAGDIGAAWRIALDPANDWSLVTSSVVSATVPLTTGHQCAVSDDGQIFWYSSEDHILRALNTTTWTALLSSEFDGNVGEGAKLIYVASFSPQIIPEPSSMFSVGSLLGTALILVRRRR